MQTMKLSGNLSTAKNVIADAISAGVELFTIDHKSFQGSVFKVTYSRYGAQVINVYALTNGVISDLPETTKKPKAVMAWCAPFPTEDPALFIKYVTYAKAVAKHVEAGGDLFPLYAFAGVEVPTDYRFKAYDIDSEAGYNPVVEASVFFASHELRTIEGVAPVVASEPVEVADIEEAETVEAVEAETVEVVEETPVETIEETPTIEETMNTKVIIVNTGETGTSKKDRATKLASKVKKNKPTYLKSSHFTDTNPMCFEVNENHISIVAVVDGAVKYLDTPDYTFEVQGGDYAKAFALAIPKVSKAYSVYRDTVHSGTVKTAETIAA